MASSIQNKEIIQELKEKNGRLVKRIHQRYNFRCIPAVCYEEKSDSDDENEFKGDEVFEKTNGVKRRSRSEEGRKLRRSSRLMYRQRRTRSEMGWREFNYIIRTVANNKFCVGCSEKNSLNNSIMRQRARSLDITRLDGYHNEKQLATSKESFDIEEVVKVKHARRGRPRTTNVGKDVTKPCTVVISRTNTTQIEIPTKKPRRKSVGDQHYQIEDLMSESANSNKNINIKLHRQQITQTWEFVSQTNMKKHVNNNNADSSYENAITFGAIQQNNLGTPAANHFFVNKNHNDLQDNCTETLLGLKDLSLEDDAGTSLVQSEKICFNSRDPRRRSFSEKRTKNHDMNLETTENHQKNNNELTNKPNNYENIKNKFYQRDMFMMNNSVGNSKISHQNNLLKIYDNRERNSLGNQMICYENFESNNNKTSYNKAKNTENIVSISEIRNTSDLRIPPQRNISEQNYSGERRSLGNQTVCNDNINRSLSMENIESGAVQKADSINTKVSLNVNRASKPRKNSISSLKELQTPKKPMERRKSLCLESFATEENLPLKTATFHKLLKNNLILNEEKVSLKISVPLEKLGKMSETFLKERSQHLKELNNILTGGDSPMEHYKKRLLQQHEVRESETDPKSTSEKVPDKESEQEPHGEAEKEQQEAQQQNLENGEKRESNGKTTKVVPKRKSVCRAQFRHSALPLIKLGTGVTTSLCKTKQPYTISAESIQMSYETNGSDVNTINTKETSQNQEDTTKQTQIPEEDINKNVLPLKHNLPAIVQENHCRTHKKNSMRRYSMGSLISDESNESTNSKQALSEPTHSRTQTSPMNLALHEDVEPEREIVRVENPNVKTISIQIGNREEEEIPIGTNLVETVKSILALAHSTMRHSKMPVDNLMILNKFYIDLKHYLNSNIEEKIKCEIHETLLNIVGYVAYHLLEGTKYQKIYLEQMLSINLQPHKEFFVNHGQTLKQNFNNDSWMKIFLEKLAWYPPLSDPLPPGQIRVVHMESIKEPTVQQSNRRPKPQANIGALKKQKTNHGVNNSCAQKPIVFKTNTMSFPDSLWNQQMSRPMENVNQKVPKLPGRQSGASKPACTTVSSGTEPRISIQNGIGNPEIQRVPSRADIEYGSNNSNHVRIRSSSVGSRDSIGAYPPLNESITRNSMELTGFATDNIRNFVPVSQSILQENHARGVIMSNVAFENNLRHQIERDNQNMMTANNENLFQNGLRNSINVESQYMRHTRNQTEIEPHIANNTNLRQNFVRNGANFTADPRRSTTTSGMANTVLHGNLNMLEPQANYKSMLDHKPPQQFGETNPLLINRRQTETRNQFPVPNSNHIKNGYGMSVNSRTPNNNGPMEPINQYQNDGNLNVPPYIDTPRNLTISRIIRPSAMETGIGFQNGTADVNPVQNQLDSNEEPRNQYEGTSLTYSITKNQWNHRILHQNSGGSCTRQDNVGSHQMQSGHAPADGTCSSPERDRSREKMIVTNDDSMMITRVSCKHEKNKSTVEEQGVVVVERVTNEIARLPVYENDGDDVICIDDDDGPTGGGVNWRSWMRGEDGRRLFNMSRENSNSSDPSGGELVQISITNNNNRRETYTIRHSDIASIPNGQLTYNILSHSFTRCTQGANSMFQMETKLPENVVFSQEENLVDPEMYVQEYDAVIAYIPKDFASYYKFVTFYQIIRNNSPVSFMTFLTMHNANALSDLFKKYLHSLEQKAQRAIA